MKYLVTGGAGFIGSNIVSALIDQGEQVSVIDDLSTGNPKNLDPFRDAITFHEGSILDSKLLAEAMEGVDAVLHQAAIPSVPRSIKNPLATHEANATGTLSVLTVAKEVGIKRVVTASSSSVYGDTLTLPKREDMALQPLSPYAVSKLTGEHYVKVFHDLFGMETVSLRYFNVFGPRQNLHGDYAAVIPKFIAALKRDEQPIIFGDGSQTRDFNYVSNVIKANLLAAKTEEIGGQTFNIAAGIQITIKALAERIAALMDKDIRPKMVEERPGDIKHSFADITKAKEHLGYKVGVNFDDGLKETVRWFL